MFKAISFQQLSAFPTQRTLVLTANNRLSVFIKSELLEYDRVERKVVSLPEISPYKAWLAQLSQQLAFQAPDMPLVLNETAQQWYWSKTLRKQLSEEQQKSFNIPAAAAMLSQARQLKTEWSIDVRSNEINPEYEAFEEWLSDYQQALQQLSAWDNARLSEALLTTIQQGNMVIPERIVLAGFYSFSPYQQRLLQTFAAQGAKIFTLTIHRKKAQTIGVYKAEDTYKEVQGALKWLVYQADNISQANQNRLAKVALVVPNLQQEAALLQRVVRRTLRGTSLANRWHMAVGRPLTEWGLIRSILSWFSLIVAFRQSQGVAIEKVGGALLNAEFAFNAQQRDALILWDTQLRESPSSVVTLRSFIERLSKISPERAATFKQAVDTWFQHQRRCADWIQLYRDTLLAFGFPGEQLSSVHYQLCQAFEQALKSFSVLDEMLPSMKADEVLQLFQQHLAQRSFQSKRHPDVRLDIVGLYELEGGKWDAVWVVGLTDDVLPQRPTPNPYIPIRSQRRAQVMHATPESEMQWAIQIFEAILHSAQHVRLSYPMANNDAVLRPSSLLKPYLTNAKALSLSVATSTTAPSMEYIEDSRGIPKQGVMRGGYGLLEKQSRNPLWAYAVSRLGLKALPTYPESDLTVFVKGNFLHKVMELFYGELSSQALLQDEGLIEETLNNVLEKAAQTELGHIHAQSLKTLTIERTKALAKRFIAFDRDKRLDFDVFARESTYSFDAHGIHLNFKVDRIDKTTEGAWLFIDYKTGTIPTLKECRERWMERPRLIDLQLPLYAAILEIAEHHEVVGVAFASLARGKTFYEGLWQSHQYEGQKDDSVLEIGEWLAVNQQWQNKIDGLFAELAQGEASNRYYREEDMKYCDIYPFLRLHVTPEQEGEE